MTRIRIIESGFVGERVGRGLISLGHDVIFYDIADVENKKVSMVSTAVKEMGKVELVNLERLAYLLKGLSATELETLELLLDEDAFRSINPSLKELEKGAGIPIDEW
ncbi:MAG: hypothetical protein KAT65_23925 [Methanophagales archaeon]|nr:hypothetical protein [Methanophagales archaeon]